MTHLRKHKLFEKGKKKLFGELDCISIIKAIRQLKLLTQVFLNDKQKLLLRF